ncbi:MAG: hypothetical protein K8R48_06910 [Alphaproteobacteria bacterium]|nr:hypothetical protein [Alphaproteobacteria bacterium]
MTPDEQNQTSTSQEEMVPSLSTTSNAPIPMPEQDAANANQKRTKLHEVINEAWGYNWLDNDAFASIIKYADPEMAQKNKMGFELDLLNGKKIKFYHPTPNDPNERIAGPKKELDQDTAAAMVALARLRGWKTMNVHGTVEQKEMLWLAVMRQNLLEIDAFERDQKNGKIPKKDQDGKEIPFSPLSVANFVPLADSPVYQQWLQEEAEWKAKHAPAPELTRDTGTGAPEKKAVPDENKKTEPEKTADKTEDKKPEAETKKPETEVKKPEPEKKSDTITGSKFAAKADNNSKFMGKGPGNQFSSKFNKVNSKPHNNKTHHKHRGPDRHKPH